MFPFHTVHMAVTHLCPNGVVHASSALHYLVLSYSILVWWVGGNEMHCATGLRAFSYVSCRVHTRVRIYQCKCLVLQENFWVFNLLIQNLGKDSVILCLVIHTPFDYIPQKGKYNIKEKRCCCIRQKDVWEFLLLSTWQKLVLVKKIISSVMINGVPFRIGQCFPYRQNPLRNHCKKNPICSLFLWLNIDNIQKQVFIWDEIFPHTHQGGFAELLMLTVALLLTSSDFDFWSFSFLLIILQL